MTRQMHIILISESASLSINFKNMLAVRDKEIALLSIQYPDLRKRNEARRSKRLVKDTLLVGDSLTVFIHCKQMFPDFPSFSVENWPDCWPEIGPIPCFIKPRCFRPLLWFTKVFLSTLNGLDMHSAICWQYLSKTGCRRVRCFFFFCISYC